MRSVGNCQAAIVPRAEEVRLKPSRSEASTARSADAMHRVPLTTVAGDRRCRVGMNTHASKAKARAAVTR